RKLSGPPRSRAPGWRHRCRITCLAASPDGSLYLGTEQGELMRWKPPRERPDLLHAAGSRAALAWLAANGEHVACAWADGTAALWSGEAMRPLDGPWDLRELLGLIAWPDGAFVWPCAGGSVWVSRGEECYPAHLPTREPLR